MTVLERTSVGGGGTERRQRPTESHECLRGPTKTSLTRSTTKIAFPIFGWETRFGFFGFTYWSLVFFEIIYCPLTIKLKLFFLKSNQTLKSNNLIGKLVN